MTRSNAHKTAKSRQKSLTLFNAHYMGIVIQNNDPLKRGRIKVYIPHISSTAYEGWTKINENKLFKFLGKNVKGDLNGIGATDKTQFDILDQLKGILPWAECAAPLIGSLGSGRYNAYTETGTISDSNRLEEVKNKVNFIPSKYSLNKDGFGEKPARLYEVNELQINDAFNKTTKAEVNDYDYTNNGETATGNPNRVNQFSYNYKPSSYSNSAKGSFSIPNVGAHVWIFFEVGDPMKPIYFATHYGAQDWQSIYDTSSNAGYDYPGAYENESKTDNPNYNNNIEQYRSKYVLNQKGGTFEIINSDNKEALKLTHFSGSFKEFNNRTNIEFSSNNDQRLVMGDKFETIRGDSNLYTQKDLDQIIRGDEYIKIGNFSKEAFTKWKRIADQIAYVKALFEIRRTDFTDTSDSKFFYQSPLQIKSGSHAPCPLCTGSSQTPLNISQYVWDDQYQINGYTQVNSTGKFAALGGEINWTSVFDGINDSSFFSGGATGGIAGGESKVIKSTPHDSSKRVPSLVVPRGGPTNFLGSGICPVCRGSGLSPATQDGTWETENKNFLLQEKFKSNVEELTAIEKQLGQGGSLIQHITKHKFETIGLLMNDFPNIRMDPVGKITNNEVIIGRLGAVTSLKTSPIFEYVHVEDLPGGTYSLNVANRFNVQVGSGGILLKSYGPVDISGSITNLTGEQINISSANEINIVSDKRIYIESDILVLKNKYNKQVLIDSNLGISQNAVVAGSLHVEGEMSVHHITAPTEIQETEEVRLMGKVQEGVPYQCHIVIPADCGDGCAAKDQPQATITFFGGGKQPVVYTAPHSHQFRNLPLTLTGSKEDVRQAGRNNTISAQKTSALPVVNEKKTPNSFPKIS